MEKIRSSHFAISVVLLLSTLSISPLAYSSFSPKQMNKKNAAEGSYLFVQSATEAIIKINKNSGNTYTITLKNIDPQVTYFSDRPIRNAGELPIEKFLKLWHHKDANSFQTTPPNAVLHAKITSFLSDDQVFNFAIELTHPHYDSKSKTLIFIAKPLPGNVDPLPDSAVLDHVSLFIDSVCLTCWGK